VNVYGRRYVVDFDFFRDGRAVTIGSTWIVRSQDGLPRLTSCYDHKQGAAHGWH
jgi:hypothetical protein